MAHPQTAMDDWGKGIFETGHANATVRVLDEVFGLRELRAKFNGRAGVQGDSTSNRFSIYAEICHGTTSIEIVRKYLDSGALAKYYGELTKDDRCWTGDDAYRFTLVAAGAMSLGCTIPTKMKEMLEKMQNPKYVQALQKQLGKPSGFLAFSPVARAQLKKAVNSYQNGTPYDFGNKHVYAAMASKIIPNAQSTTTNVGRQKVIKTKLPGGKMIPQIIGAPTDEELGLPRIHPYHVCAACGAEKANYGKDDGDLMVCARCHDRKYCSKTCQKKHWKLHRAICTIPAEEMDEFLQSVASCGIDSGDDDLVQAMENL